MLCANLVSTKLRRNQFCFHNCNLRVRSSLTKLYYRKKLTNLLDARGANLCTHTDIHIYRHINTYKHILHMFIIIINTLYIMHILHIYIIYISHNNMYYIYVIIYIHNYYYIHLYPVGYLGSYSSCFKGSRWQFPCEKSRQ